MQRAGRDPGIECIVREEVKGERGVESSVKGVSRKKRERERDREKERKEWKSVGTARLECCIESQRCRCIAYRCVTLLCSVSFNLESLARRSSGRSYRSARRLCCISLFSLSSHYPRNSQFLNSSIEFFSFFFFLFLDLS